MKLGSPLATTASPLRPLRQARWDGVVGPPGPGEKRAGEVREGLLAPPPPAPKALLPPPPMVAASSRRGDDRPPILGSEAGRGREEEEGARVRLGCEGGRAPVPKPLPDAVAVKEKEGVRVSMPMPPLSPPAPPGDPMEVANAAAAARAVARSLQPQKQTQGINGTC